MSGLVGATSIFFARNPSDFAGVCNNLLWIADLIRPNSIPYAAAFKRHFSIAKQCMAMSKMGEKSSSIFTLLQSTEISHGRLARLAEWVQGACDSLEFIKSASGRLTGVTAVAEKVNLVAMLVSSSWGMRKAYGEWKNRNFKLDWKVAPLVATGAYGVFSVVALLGFVRQRSLNVRMPGWAACSLISLGGFAKVAGGIEALMHERARG